MLFDARALTSLVILIHCVGCYEHHLRDNVDASSPVADTGVPFADAGEDSAVDAQVDAQLDATDDGHVDTGIDAQVTRGCYVPQDYPTIQAALDDSNCDPIIVTTDQTVSTVWIMRDVTITTPDETTFITVSGDGTGSVFVVTAAATVVFDRIHISDGYSNLGGGINSAGDLTLRDVTIHDNAATISGGGLNQTDGRVHFAGQITFENNRAAGQAMGAYGGAMYLQGSEVTFDGSLLIRNNQAEGEIALGGGIYIVGGSLRGGPGLVMENNIATARCIHSGTAANAFGGAIGSAADVDLVAPVFTANIAQAFGDGAGCLAIARGGAVHGPATIRSGSASNNAALAEVHDTQSMAEAGGGFIAEGELIEDMEITDNRSGASAFDGSGAASHGGAIFSLQTIRRSRLTHNSVGTTLHGAALPPESSVWSYGPFGAWGGAIATSASTLDLRDSLVMSNSATLTVTGTRGGGSEIAAGGGVALGANIDRFSNPASILRTSLIGNTVTTRGEQGAVWGFGGGIALLNGFGAAVTVVSSTVSENHIVGEQLGARTVGRGGAISVDDHGATPSLDLFGTTIANNDIVADDAINAGIFCPGPASASAISITNSILWQNLTYGRLVDDCTGTVNGSHNLTSSTWCFPSTEPTNQTIDPQLLPLTAISDTCWVHPISTSSAAHDYGTDGCLSPNGDDAAIDQCGRPRTGACDVGAVEAQP